jgi:hypothetical protein
MIVNLLETDGLGTIQLFTVYTEQFVFVSKQPDKVWSALKVSS